MSFVEGYFALGRWVEDIRAIRETLSESEAAELSSVPGWDWVSTAKRTRRDYEDNFDVGFAVLKDFVEDSGSATHIRYDTELGRWAKSRRTEYGRGELSTERVRALEGVRGWAWSLQDAKYERAIEYFSDFVAAFGHGDVPPHYRTLDDGYSLGGWVTRQRDLKRAGELRQDRKVRLEELQGWRW